jgi:hypothetical protein
MAQRTQIVFTDDLDGSEASETIRFGLAGTQHEIDLNAEHADQFRNAIQPYISSGRKIGGSVRRSSRGAGRSGPSPQEIRAWAKGQGLKVNERGRVPAELIVKFQAASQ